jgi:hypothetical protein
VRFKEPEEEMEHRQEKVERATILYRQMLPALLNKLSRIKDPRNPHKIKHKMTVLMAYGILLFVYQTGSRREANKQMSRPIFWSNVKAMFPDLKPCSCNTMARLIEENVEETRSAL